MTVRVMEETEMGLLNHHMENGERCQILSPYLNADEQVLWSGNPCTTRKINSPTIPTDRFLLIDGVDGVYRLIMDRIEVQK